MKFVAGLFDTTEHLNAALDELEATGYSSKDISVITREDVANNNVTIENDVSGGVTSGVKTGGVIGGVLGLLVGIGVLAIPGIGALFIAGPIAAALGITGVAGATVSGALTGAIAGGLVSALKEVGFDELKAKRYEDAIKGGNMMLGVNVHETANTSEIEDIFSRHHANEVTTFDMKS